MYIIKDWAGNIMDLGEFERLEDASESLSLHVTKELKEEGLDINKLSRLCNEYPCLDDAIEHIFDEYREEYCVEDTEDDIS